MKPERTNKQWTAEEVAELRRLGGLGCSTARIANELKRTKGGVYSALAKLNEGKSLGGPSVKGGRGRVLYYALPMGSQESHAFLSKASAESFMAENPNYRILKPVETETVTVIKD